MPHARSVLPCCGIDLFQTQERQETQSRHTPHGEEHTTSQMVCRPMPVADADPTTSRHKRTHDRDGAEAGFSLSGEDEEEYSGEDQLGSLEEASPNSETGYVTTSLNSVVHGGLPASNGVNPAPGMPDSNASFNSLQTLSMPMTLSQPQAINAGALM